MGIVVPGSGDDPRYRLSSTVGTTYPPARAPGLDVEAAKGYVEGGLRRALAIGGGQGPLCHWHALEPEQAQPKRGAGTHRRDKHQGGGRGEKAPNPRASASRWSGR